MVSKIAAWLSLLLRLAVGIVKLQELCSNRGET